MRTVQTMSRTVMAQLSTDEQPHQREPGNDKQQNRGHGLSLVDRQDFG